MAMAAAAVVGREEEDRPFSAPVAVEGGVAGMEEVVETVLLAPVSGLDEFVALVRSEGLAWREMSVAAVGKEVSRTRRERGSASAG